MAGVINPYNNGYSAPLLTSTGVIFRHPNLSANFVYFDAHAENLKAGEIDGGPLYNDAGALNASALGVGCIGDARLLADH
jgi:prepilin-type processing-associated H-X9-DG protein